jgi:N utilization substance protein A
MVVGAAPVSAAAGPVQFNRDIRPILSEHCFSCHGPDVQKMKGGLRLDRREEANRTERRELGVEDAVAELPILTEAMLVVLGKAGIKTLDDLADLATDELIQKAREPRRNERSDREMRRNRTEDKAGILAVFGLSEDQGNEIIMAARAHWFEEEDAIAADVSQ